MNKEDSVNVESQQAEELTPLDLVRQKYMTSEKHPKSDVLNDADLALMPSFERQIILAARKKRVR